MNEERRAILEMLRDGVVSVEDAERLMSVTSGGKEPRNVTARGIQPKRIRILVDQSGKPAANICIPMSLIKVGLKLGKTFAFVAARYANDSDAELAINALNEIDMDEILSALEDGEITLPYVIVDVVEGGESCKIIIE